MEKYDVEGLKKAYPVPTGTISFREFLQFGGAIELCETILNGGLEDPWLTHALQVVPHNAMIVAVVRRSHE